MQFIPSIEFISYENYEDRSNDFSFEYLLNNKDKIIYYDGQESLVKDYLTVFALNTEASKSFFGGFYDDLLRNNHQFKDASLFDFQNPLENSVFYYSLTCYEYTQDNPNSLRRKGMCNNISNYFISKDKTLLLRENETIFELESSFYEHPSKDYEVGFYNLI
jgi:hypothetical protein